VRMPSMTVICSSVGGVRKGGLDFQQSVTGEARVMGFEPLHRLRVFHGADAVPFGFLREDFFYSPRNVEFFGRIKVKIFRKSIKPITKQKGCAAFEHHGDIVKFTGDGSHDVYMELPFFIEG